MCLISFHCDFLLKSQARWSERILERIDSQCLEVRFNVMDNFGAYIHTLFIPEADDNYYIQIKLKRKYF